MKKGFTLIELIATIILLGVIGLIIIPTVSRTIKENRQKLYESQIEEIELAAEKWAYKNMDLLPTKDEAVITITLLDLKRSGDIKVNVKDPRTNDLFPNDMVIKIIYVNNNYIFEVDEESGTSTDTTIDEYSPTIILKGSIIQYVPYGEEYEEMGVIAKDANGNIIDDDKITRQFLLNGDEVTEIRTDSVDTYVVKYSVTASGRTSTIQRTVIITDQ